ncbi:MAG: hypothetical protein WBE84_10365, partial [Xanthobacteraceae bacterium]
MAKIAAVTFELTAITKPPPSLSFPISDHYHFVTRLTDYYRIDSLPLVGHICRPRVRPTNPSPLASWGFC